MAVEPSSSPLLRDLQRSVPSLQLSADRVEATAYSRDMWPRHHFIVREWGEPSEEHRPLAVVWPDSTQQVAQLVRWAYETETPLTPFGAGSGVCGAILPRRGSIVVDLKRMGAIRKLQPDQGLVEVEAGCMGQSLEDALAQRGQTLGHFPSSMPCSTVGGWIAARSAGQCSSRYGKIEDMVVALECVTGTGDVVRLAHRDRGPNLVPLVVGSEGTLAIVTSAQLRTHPMPEVRAFGAWSFPTLDHGWDALRGLLQAGLRPAVARLYDALDTRLAKGRTHARTQASPANPWRARWKEAVAGALRGALIHPRRLEAALHQLARASFLGSPMLVLIFEGPEADAAKLRATNLLRTMKSRDLGEAPARHWLSNRYAVSYRMAPIFRDGLFADTFEVSTTWANLPRLYRSVREAASHHALVLSHFSHAYADGCCIYFTFVGGAATPPREAALGWDARCLATYDDLWRDVTEAALAVDASVAHHHGIGRSKAPSLIRDLGPGTRVHQALRRAFDPKGILNPDNLIPFPSRLPVPPHHSPMPGEESLAP